jgi:uracil-DNA glycosylase family 4
MGDSEIKTSVSERARIGTQIAETPLQKCLTPCSTCPFGGPRVGSRGNPKAPIVFVAEGPGAQELKTGIPLIGPSGKVFWSTMAEGLIAHGINPQEDIYVLNAVQCLPPRRKDDTVWNNRQTQHGVEACRHRLLSLIQEHPRKLIVTMGNYATRSVTENWGAKITQVRGKLIPSKLADIGVLPIVHPAALLRGTGNYRQFKMDVRYALDLASGMPQKKPILPRRQNSIAWSDPYHRYEGEHYILCNTEKKVWAAVKELLKAEHIAADVETSGFSRWRDKLLCLGLTGDGENIYVFPEKQIPLLGWFLRRAKGRFIWHNGKFDVGFLRKVPGLGKARVDEDTMLLSYALDESSGIHDLEQVSGDLIGAPDYKAMLKPYLPNKKTSYAAIPRPVLYHYLALDVSNTWQIFKIMREWVAKDRHLEKLYTKVLLPASDLLYYVEDYGIGLCQVKVKANARRLQKEMDHALKELNLVAARFGLTSVNPNSPAQLAELLFDRVKLRPPRAGDRSTAKEVLARLPPHPVVKAVQAFRKAAKAKSTYVDSLDGNLQPDGRVHATYLIHGTRTGRLSSRKPNMQNIPRDKRIRGMFYAGKGRVYIKADLNQAELRSLAALSGDVFLCSIYEAGGKRSLHKETAKDFFGAGWTDEQLMRAKAVNFGIVYGREAPSLAEEFDTSVSEAQRWINKWFERSPLAKAFIDNCRSMPLKGRTMLTPFGRKKRHHLITQENLQGLQNEASNFPHQAIASDINLLGAAKARPLLRCIGFHPVNLVHDEVMFEGPDDPVLIQLAKDIIIKSMEAVPVEWGITQVPFKAEADVGRRWSIYRKEFA